MFRIGLIAMTVLFSASAIAPASAQSKYSPAKLKEMRATWAKNKPKYKDCRAQVKKNGLAGDERWFFMQDCMNKS